MIRSENDSTRKINLATNVDWFTICIYLVLVIAGWFNIYAAVYNDEYQSIFDISQKYGKQMLWIGAAFVLIFFIFLTDSNFFSFFSYFFYAGVIILLFSVIFFGKEVNGARAWFEIGGFRLQPGEFGKLAATLVIAKYLSSVNQNVGRERTIFMIAVLLAIPSGLIILQNDTGTALVYSAFALVLYREGWFPGYILFFGVLIIGLFIATLLANPTALVIFLIITAFIAFGILRRRVKEFLITVGIWLLLFGLSYGVNYFIGKKFSLYMILAVSTGLSCIAYLILNYFQNIKFGSVIALFLIASISFTFTVDYIFHKVLEPHQRLRITVLLGMETDLKGAGYNVNQSKIAIGSGGFTGKGFLQGTQTKYDFVPEQSTDFIFCTIGEEWGFIGSFFIIGLFVLLLLRIIYLAERQRSHFSRIYGYSVASILFFHLVVNIGMTIGLMPVIGIPLPFFSYGGSSLWAFTILLFIFIRLDASRLELLA